ncbi:hypothetical protein [Acidovorax sp. FHTAMBA]|jgi:hypothetical protein|uniref:hypothetical protein n=1 Tax=Acidovorax sp. FHTAMBA TaxID=3140252 RepID=UPI0015F5440F
MALLKAWCTGTKNKSKKKTFRTHSKKDGGRAAVRSARSGDLGESWGAVRFSVCLHLIDDDVENVAPPQIAPSPAPAKDLRL